MQLFGIGGFELLLIALVAFIILGPRGLMDGARTAGKFMRDLRRQSDELQQALKDAAQFEEDLEAEMNTPPIPSGSVARSSPPGKVAASRPSSADSAKNVSEQERAPDPVRSLDQPRHQDGDDRR